NSESRPFLADFLTQVSFTQNPCKSLNGAQTAAQSGSGAHRAGCLAADRPQLQQRKQGRLRLQVHHRLRLRPPRPRFRLRPAEPGTAAAASQHPSRSSPTGHLADGRAVEAAWQPDAQLGVDELQRRPPDPLQPGGVIPADTPFMPHSVSVSASLRGDGVSYITDTAYYVNLQEGTFEYRDMEITIIKYP
ncbi:hypothetical protein BOX15_Mlig025402g2, partial [Macrostomum lignano]